MTGPISPADISIVLTATVDPKGVALMQRSDPQARLNDYQNALHRWVGDPWASNLIVVENSGYPLDALKQIADTVAKTKKIEFLSFDGQDFPRHLGKGYGETLALTHVLQNSRQLRATTRFLKINGRYYVPELGRVVSGMLTKTQIFCNLNRSMTYSDSRFFAGDLDFLSRVCAEGLTVNDHEGVWLEHALARSVLRGIADGLSWRFISTLPKIEGTSGTTGQDYIEFAPKRWARGRAHALKQRLLEW